VAKLLQERLLPKAIVPHKRKATSFSVTQAAAGEHQGNLLLEKKPAAAPSHPLEADWRYC
jgi:hypothetical protein